MREESSTQTNALNKIRSYNSSKFYPIFVFFNLNILPTYEAVEKTQGFQILTKDLGVLLEFSKHIQLYIDYKDYEGGDQASSDIIYGRCVIYMCVCGKGV